jgi:hypothetical protein
MNKLANLYQLHGKLEDAEELYVDCYAARKQVLGQDHPDTLTTGISFFSIYFVTFTA